MTWSVVRGTNKSDMTVDSNIGVTTRTLDGGNDTIVTATQEFLQLIRRVVPMQQSSEPIPVVYGSSVEIHAKDLVLSLICEFRSEIAEAAAFENPACIDHLLRQTPGITEQMLQKEALKIVWQKLMENSVRRGALQYEIRDYAAAGCAGDWWDSDPQAIVLQGQSQGERTRLTQSIIAPELRARFDTAYMDVVMRRDDSKRGELEGIVREIAAQFVRYGMVARDERGKVVNRFISAATTPDLTSESDIRNFIFLDAGLRKVYGEEFIRLQNIDHNVCFKTSLDKSNPPFADIAGTFLADQFDARDGTKPTAVMVRRDN